MPICLNALSLPAAAASVIRAKLSATDAPVTFVVASTIRMNSTSWSGLIPIINAFAETDAASAIEIRPLDASSTELTICLAETLYFVASASRDAICSSKAAALSASAHA
ncbi:MAG: hypothetical protein DDT19_02795 [Syntrophomonadaceae bacterium]|nr:hypothetical protein [Bacillota bacterium]